MIAVSFLSVQGRFSLDFRLQTGTVTTFSSLWKENVVGLIENPRSHVEQWCGNKYGRVRDRRWMSWLDAGDGFVLVANHQRIVRCMFWWLGDHPNPKEGCERCNNKSSRRHWRHWHSKRYNKFTRKHILPSEKMKLSLLTVFQLVLVFVPNVVAFQPIPFYSSFINKNGIVKKGINKVQQQKVITTSKTKLCSSGSNDAESSSSGGSGENWIQKCRRITNACVVRTVFIFCIVWIVSVYSYLHKLCRSSYRVTNDFCRSNF